MKQHKQNVFLLVNFCPLRKSVPSCAHQWGWLDAVTSRNLRTISILVSLGALPCIWCLLPWQKRKKPFFCACFHLTLNHEREFPLCAFCCFVLCAGIRRLVISFLWTSFEILSEKTFSDQPSFLFLFLRAGITHSGGCSGSGGTHRLQCKDNEILDIQDTLFAAVQDWSQCSTTRLVPAVEDLPSECKVPRTSTNSVGRFVYRRWVDSAACLCPCLQTQHNSVSVHEDIGQFQHSVRQVCIFLQVPRQAGMHAWRGFGARSWNPEVSTSRHRGLCD